jgi:large-conductance mechanosensitive channel
MLYLHPIRKNIAKKKEAEPPAPPTPPKEQLLLTEIRDTLKEIQKTSR